MNRAKTEAYERFKRNYLESVPSVIRMALYLLKQGWTCEIDPIRIYEPEKGEKWEDFIDLGDMRVRNSLHGGPYTVEVKWSSTRFSSADDFPYWYKDGPHQGEIKLIVDAKDSFERKLHLPSAYYILSADMKAHAMVRTDRCNEWWSEEESDRTGGRTKEYMFAPLRHIAFRPMDDL